MRHGAMMLLVAILTLGAGTGAAQMHGGGSEHPMMGGQHMMGSGMNHNMGMMCNMMGDMQHMMGARMTSEQHQQMLDMMKTFLKKTSSHKDWYLKKIGAYLKNMHWLFFKGEKRLLRNKA